LPIVELAKWPAVVRPSGRRRFGRVAAACWANRSVDGASDRRSFGQVAVGDLPNAAAVRPSGHRWFGQVATARSVKWPRPAEPTGPVKGGKWPTIDWPSGRGRFAAATVSVSASR